MIDQTSGRFNAVISEEALADEIVGRVLPDGGYRIEPYLAWLVADAVESPGLGVGLAHPMFTYFAAQGGIGVTLDELFAMAYATSDDGVMLGTAELDIVRPLEVGQRFDVVGTVEDVTRKSGRTGVFDIVTYRLEMRDAAVLCATLTLGFIYPRESRR
ncbi:hypothetical protein [Euzebya tangerina]|uniref:hypothetical protein n=1 Tax=Euzebya tangerina TaxID=591198 RepID=UPI0013C2D812|nr:hypothetical protein [Euzebya tangerina]